MIHDYKIIFNKFRRIGYNYFTVKIFKKISYQNYLFTCNLILILINLTRIVLICIYVCDIFCKYILYWKNNS